MAATGNCFTPGVSDCLPPPPPPPPPPPGCRGNRYAPRHLGIRSDLITVNLYSKARLSLHSRSSAPLPSPVRRQVVCPVWDTLFNSGGLLCLHFPICISWVIRSI